MGKILAVVNQKGGVGKTTTAVNLAAALAIAEKPILLVDTDPQASCTRALGLSATTVKDEWKFARAWLAGEIAPDEEPGE